jgi:tetratricopeptide (TPR) repeat protein
MFKLFSVFSLAAVLSLLLGQNRSAWAQGSSPAAQNPAPAAPKAPASSQKPAGPQKPMPAQSQGGFIPPMEINAEIEGDVRTMVVMAAVNMAGFDAETAGQPLSPARAELRKDLAKMDPALRTKLTAYYKSHRRPSVEETFDVLRYQALSLLMDAPPSFEIAKASNLPDDLRPLVDFAPLVQEFYASSGIQQVLGKYLRLGEVYAGYYRRPVGGVIFDTLNYFHTTPDTIITVHPFETDQHTGERRMTIHSRTRYMYIIMDPLGPFGASMVRGDILNLRPDRARRKVGDDYIVVIGPARVPITDGLREALIRFAVDPALERHLSAFLDYKDPITKLVGSAPAAEREFVTSVYLVVRESLAVAAEARMKRIRSSGENDQYNEDDAVFDLAAAYKRGAVLVFHFYDALKGFESVGINIEDFLDEMVATTDFAAEANRPKQFGPIVAKVAALRSRNAASSPTTAPSALRPGEAAPEVNEKVLESDNLIRARKFAEARTYLQEILAAQPNNARAVYGMAQVVNGDPSQVESDPKADENDKIQAQHDRLELAISLYRKAIQLASGDSERWLIQWSHVFVGHILDFQEFRVDALAEYDQAIALGDVPGGAYKEATEGKEHPFGQK